MRIVLVEDDEFFQKFYSFKLREQGFTVDVGSDGVQGLNLMLQSIPDLVLLDLIMPNKDGFEVLSEMKKNPALLNVPVLVFSTLSQEQDIKKAMELGAVGYANKSFFDFDKLLAQIREVLSKRP